LAGGAGGGGGGGGSGSGGGAARASRGDAAPPDSAHPVGFSTGSHSRDVHDLERQLQALHALHSSYQPEHHYLTCLLSNAAHLEATYVSIIENLYSFVQQQHAAHASELQQKDAMIAQQQRQIELLEETMRQHGQYGFQPAGTSHTPLGISHASGLQPPPLPRARSTGDPVSQRSTSAHAHASHPSSRASPSPYSSSVGSHSYTLQRPMSAGNAPTHACAFPMPPQHQFPDPSSEAAYLELPDEQLQSAGSMHIGRSITHSSRVPHAYLSQQLQQQQQQLQFQQATHSHQDVYRSASPSYSSHSLADPASPVHSSGRAASNPTTPLTASPSRGSFIHMPLGSAGSSAGSLR